jgi:hypothetical protein
MYRKNKYEVGEPVKIPASVELFHPSISSAYNYRQTKIPEIGWVVEDNYTHVKILTNDNIVWDTDKLNIYTYGETNG